MKPSKIEETERKCRFLRRSRAFPWGRNSNLLQFRSFPSDNVGIKTISMCRSDMCRAAFPFWHIITLCEVCSLTPPAVFCICGSYGCSEHFPPGRQERHWCKCPVPGVRDWSGYEGRGISDQENTDIYGLDETGHRWGPNLGEFNRKVLQNSTLRPYKFKVLFAKLLRESPDNFI